MEWKRKTGHLTMIDSNHDGLAKRPHVGLQPVALAVVIHSVRVGERERRDGPARHQRET